MMARIQARCARCDSDEQQALSKPMVEEKEQEETQAKATGIEQAVSQNEISILSNTAIAESSPKLQAAAALAAPAAVFGPVGIGVAIGVATGVTITVWLNNGGWQQIGEITNALGKGIEGTLKELREILNRAGEAARNQLDRIEDFVRNVFRSQESEESEEEEGEQERDWKKDRKLSDGEIKKLKDAGYDIHELKSDCPAGAPSRCDLFKDREGNIYVKPKNGQGPGNPVDVNINNL